MISRRNTYLFLLLGAVTVVAIIGFQYTKMVLDEQASRLNASQKGGDEHAEAGNITLTETENGHKRWEITTAKADYDPKANFSNLDKLTGKVFNDAEEVQFEFSATKGRYYKDKKSFELYDGASLIAPKSKVVVKASRILWPSSKANIQASGGVVLDKPGNATTSAGAASFSQDFSYVEFSGGVVTRIQ
jgi:LPS export ABC transporter protein LptC